jgi:hypothetical protein
MCYHHHHYFFFLWLPNRTFFMPSNNSYLWFFIITLLRPFLFFFYVFLTSDMLYCPYFFISIWVFDSPSTVFLIHLIIGLWSQSGWKIKLWPLETSNATPQFYSPVLIQYESSPSVQTVIDWWRFDVDDDVRRRLRVGHEVKSRSTLMYGRNLSLNQW